MLDVLIGAAAIYLILAAIGGLVSIGLFVWLFRSMTKDLLR